MRHYFSLPKEGVIFQDSKRPGKKCPHFPWQTACCVLQVADRQIETEFFFLFFSSWLFGLSPNEALGETLQDERDSGGTRCHRAIKSLTF